jgi:hypothetical protein
LSAEPRLTLALHHEFIRCQDAFDKFVALGQLSIQSPEDRKTAYQLYNSYSQFVHHLYEFYKGILELNKRLRKPSETKSIDFVLDRELEKIVRNRRAALEGGYAPTWENGIECYPLADMTGFGKRFREVRDMSFGHVSENRVATSLSAFFEDHHRDLMMLFEAAQFSWSLKPGEFPDLGEITAFQTRVLKLNALKRAAPAK